MKYCSPNVFNTLHFVAAKMDVHKNSITKYCIIVILFVYCCQINNSRIITYLKYCFNLAKLSTQYFQKNK